MSDADALTFIGTATTLLRRHGMTVLTDPNFLRRGQRAYLGNGLWSKRLTDPAMEPHELPDLDVINLSHLHSDHYDRVAKAGLDPRVPVVTTQQSARRLRRRKINAQPLPTWESWEVSRGGTTLTITSLPGHHARGPMESAIPKVMGSLLEFRNDGGMPYLVYVSGDTLLSDDLREIARRVPDIDLALIHLGGTRLLGMTLTMDGRQGADLLELLHIDRRTRVVPIHYDDYPVFRSPLSDFRDEIARRGLDVDVRYVQRGDVLPL